jgi:hypothetical protein
MCTGSSVSVIFSGSMDCRVRSGMATGWFDALDDTVLDLLSGPDDPFEDAVDACRSGLG